MAEGNVATLMENRFALITPTAELIFGSTVVVNVDFNESRAAHGMNDTQGTFAKTSVTLNFRQA